jgi:haloalkane dehalogenase
MRDVLRTPEERFQNFPDFPYALNNREDLAGFGRLRVHYVDAGSPEGDQVFLCLHGEPTWSYRYRKMIPVFTAAGHRVVAPDMFGFRRVNCPMISMCVA